MGAKQGSESRQTSAASAAAGCSARVLVVGPTRAARDGARARLSRGGLQAEAVGLVSAAADRVGEGSVDVVVTYAELPDGLGLDLCRAIGETRPGVGVVVVAEEPTVEFVLDAMRAGALDVVAAEAPAGELARRVRAAAQRSERVAARERRVAQLRDLCRQLNEAREEVTKHVGEMCEDLVGAYEALGDRLVGVSAAAELQAALRPELDIEDLLRTTLEFVLAKSGPMNAGVFLPGTSGDWTLGAYVNYDAPASENEALLDHLADTLPTTVEGRREVLLMRDASSRAAVLGDDGTWFDGRSVVAFGCEHDGECLAACVFFRDERTGFDRDAMELFGVLQSVFTEQLERVIRTHHRHLPKDEWGEPWGKIEPEDGFDDGSSGWRDAA